MLIRNFVLDSRVANRTSDCGFGTVVFKVSFESINTHLLAAILTCCVFRL